MIEVIAQIRTSSVDEVTTRIDDSDQRFQKAEQQRNRSCYLTPKGSERVLWLAVIPHLNSKHSVLTPRQKQYCHPDSGHCCTFSFHPQTKETTDMWFLCVCVCVSHEENLTFYLYTTRHIFDANQCFYEIFYWWSPIF